MKTTLLTVLFIVLFLGSFAQISQHCFTDEVIKMWLNNNPELKTDYLKRQQQAWFQDSIAFVTGYSNKTMAATVYTIPVVFHVLHQNGIENISDAQILDEVNILNRDYRKLNADTINIFAPFKAADVNFEFRLATKDTNGICTNGITRHYDPNTYWTTSFFTTNEFKYTWNSTKYFNIYVVKSIVGFSYGGYSSFPGTNPNFRDVIVVTNDCIGSIGTSAPFKSRILTHETGHFFNLEHIWGNSTFSVSCGDDGVADTPITKGWGTCPSSSSLSAVCNPTITENFQNYMDYTSCKYMFTVGQAARMTAAINSTVSGRNNLWINSNLIFTGIISPLSPCAPIADCYSIYGTTKNIYTVCTGQSLTFNDATYNGTVTAWSWSATGGGIVSAPTNSSTSITFPTIGTQTVSLNVSNSVGNSTTTKTVIVLNGIANVGTTYQESFESPGLPANFNIINLDGDVTWTQTSLAAATGSNSYFIDGSLDAPASTADLLETSTYDFLNNPGATFTFKYAYARKNTSNVDAFKVQISSNCGGIWSDIFLGSNSTLSIGSGGTTTTSFVPTPAQFKVYTLSSHPAFNPFKTQSDVKVRFYFKEDTTAGYGNNIYLDDINFTSPAGINELSKSIAFNLYPNPSEDIIYLEFRLSDAAEIKYGIIDVVGRSIEPLKTVNLNSGEHKIIFNEGQKLKAGIYFINFYLNGQKISRKIIIQ